MYFIVINFCNKCITDLIENGKRLHGRWEGWERHFTGFQDTGTRVHGNKPDQEGWIFEFNKN
jgi:hypothetical protein